MTQELKQIKKNIKLSSFLILIPFILLFCYFFYLAAHFDDDKVCWAKGDEYVRKNPDSSFSYYCDYGPKTGKIGERE